MEKTAKPPVPSVGLADVFKLLTAIEEAVVSGATTIPALDIHIHGKEIELGPCPVKVKL